VPSEEVSEDSSFEGSPISAKPPLTGTIGLYAALSHYAEVAFDNVTVTPLK